MIKLDAPEGASPARMKPGIFCMLGKTTKTSPDIFLTLAPGECICRRVCIALDSTYGSTMQGAQEFIKTDLRLPNKA